MRWMRRRRRRMQGFRRIPVAGGVPTTLALKYGNRAAGSAYRRLDKRCDARSNGPPTDRTPRSKRRIKCLAVREHKRSFGEVATIRWGESSRDMAMGRERRLRNDGT
ncbi:uncharacterized protein LOC122636753 [Vespula pensylvanica]|uniref:uncharacterized protein LOC122636753 n=1 Tax=Vespula pensylvanica TaxID=30213 RepID=UPI001CBA447B|nr:uncharacterized protein LOC122636753 [Vespula pensylvanica]